MYEVHNESCQKRVGPTSPCNTIDLLNIAKRCRVYLRRSVAFVTATAGPQLGDRSKGQKINNPMFTSIYHDRGK